MKQVDFLIVGGSAAGTTAAEVIRGLAPKSSITIVTDEDHVEYSRVLLPHYIRHKVNREQVFLKKPEWYEEKLIELTRGIKVTKLNAQEHKVTLENGEEIRYGKLLVAIGGYVIKLDVPGADLENILYMRTIEDANEIIEIASKSKKGVIIGGGFIGLEFCSCFKMNGVDEVTVLVMEPYYWKGKLDEGSSKVLVATLEKNGVKVLVNEEVSRFEPLKNVILGTIRRRPERTPGSDSGQARMTDGGVGQVITKSGKAFAADVVGVGIGIKSDLSWLAGSGVKINRAIVTNEYLETNSPDIYAAGDCAEFHDVIFDRQHIMGNWANATSQGNAVGRTMSGQRTVFETASSYSINFFDGSCSFIGVTDEKFADEVMSRGSVESGKMTRIFIKKIDGVLRAIGATVINDPAEVAPLTSVVKGRIDISSNKEKLQDPNFDLSELLS